ncbi:MerR family transcriptional regulator [Anaerocolumna xylanovorans]|uniref:DNA-binding transcriptional regulator, MerR family n=1 Tax=Anaerocolumna xylanovorans DSM 12503 TaxID=1121345 RepID=A0A1M7Y1M0_9FIRM|nr:MerR family transcriptional regulator [Anaerocolumna xylanovorans]SHO45642.1 DNA-binding transcriptional regulator, MerR family [Anaerocolumna xylanovorans DSM 12503]
MFRIGEFSKLTQVSIRMLRYYDETGLLSPAVIDECTNYRLYSAEQILALNKIIFLRDLGFNVSEIAVILNQWNNEFIINQLENKRLEIENTIKTEQDKLSKIELAKRDIYQEKIAIHCNVSIKSIPSYQVLSLRRIVPDYYSEGKLWREMLVFANKGGISISNDTFTVYYDTDYREKDVDIEICAPVAGMGKDKDGFVYRNTEPVPVMASTMVYGKFENIAGAYLAFANWLQEHNQYRMEGQSRQIVHRGPWNEKIPDNYLTEIQIPMKEI